jgi:hypothetical protein
MEVIEVAVATGYAEAIAVPVYALATSDGPGVAIVKVAEYQ